MNDPVEAVARALARLRTFEGESVDDLWGDYAEDARAAITALRDCGVTEGMVTAHMLCSGMAKEQFRAMLDAALKEG